MLEVIVALAVGFFIGNKFREFEDKCAEDCGMNDFKSFTECECSEISEVRLATGNSPFSINEVVNDLIEQGFQLEGEIHAVVVSDVTTTYYATMVKYDD